jgi:hypothetical protein
MLNLLDLHPTADTAPQHRWPQPDAPSQSNHAYQFLQGVGRWGTTVHVPTNQCKGCSSCSLGRLQHVLLKGVVSV